MKIENFIVIYEKEKKRLSVDATLSISNYLPSYINGYSNFITVSHNNHPYYKRGDNSHIEFSTMAIKNYHNKKEAIEDIRHEFAHIELFKKGHLEQIAHNEDWAKMFIKLNGKNKFINKWNAIQVSNAIGKSYTSHTPHLKDILKDKAKELSKLSFAEKQEEGWNKMAHLIWVVFLMTFGMQFVLMGMSYLSYPPNYNMLHLPINISILLIDSAIIGISTCLIGIYITFIGIPKKGILKNLPIYLFVNTLLIFALFLIARYYVWFTLDISAIQIILPIMPLMYISMTLMILVIFVITILEAIKYLNNKK